MEAVEEVEETGVARKSLQPGKHLRIQSLSMQTAYGIAPRATYAPKTSWRWGLLLASVLVISLACVLLFQGGQNKRAAQMLLLVLGLAFLCLGGYMIAYVLRARIALREDAIEVSGVINRQTMSRHEILGYRKISEQSPPALVLVARSDSQRKLKIPDIFAFDSVFYEWLSTFPDLDDREAQHAEKEIADDPRLGNSPEERSRARTQAALICRVLTVVTFAVCAWGWIYPQPLWAVMLLLTVLPWAAVAVVTRYPSLVVINQKKRDPHPGVTIPFIFPGFVITLRVLSDIHMMGWQRPFWVTVFIAAVLCLAAWHSDSLLRQQHAAVLLLFVFSLAYGFGVTATANALLDRSASQIYSATILKKYVSGSRSRTYHLVVTPWGPMKTTDNPSVPYRLYRSRNVGDRVCISVSSGALKIPWYMVGSCQ